jgi:hypothetical protein
MRVDLEKLLLGEIGPDDIRWGEGVDWRFLGDYDRKMYEPKPVVEEFASMWEYKVFIILGKNDRGMWIINGPRGSGKTLAAATCAFYYKTLFGRPVASNFPLKAPFGEYRDYTLDDVRDQLERLRALPRLTGTADWKAVNLAKYKIWLPNHVMLDDELHKEGDKRRPGTDEMKLISDLVFEIRHYNIVWMGLTPDKEVLDSKRLDNDMFISTEVKCFKDVDRRSGKASVWANVYQNEGQDYQRLSSPPDAIRFDVARFCNLYWTLGVGSGGAKLTKRPAVDRRTSMLDRMREEEMALDDDAVHAAMDAERPNDVEEWVDAD